MPQQAALSQSCHFAVFVNRVARSSTDGFFTMRTWSTSARRKRRACSAGMSSCSVATLQEGPVVARSPLVGERAPHIR